RLVSGSFIIIVSFVTVLANGLLLVVFFFDPSKIFRTTTTYFLIGLAFVDILTTASQEPKYATCFKVTYLRHADSLASLFVVMGITEEIVQKIENIFHPITLSYVTIIFYVLLYIAFRKKMTASKSLREDKNTHDRGMDDKQTGVGRKFTIVNFLQIVILFFTSQPFAMLWIYRLYSNENPNTPRVLTVNLMVVNNPLYLKFLLDPFLYAWRIPKYRQALKDVLLCGREEPETIFSDRVMVQVSKSRETVVTLDFESI
ncbi:uncharacterized protein LOC111343040, partial [Stylophora pistillata]|uniref:uncharacterized protein LOC111343040 n=1 Tax=Stylophora pistillata TaxID=50429 RepID=UPI000C0431E9